MKNTLRFLPWILTVIVAILWNVSWQDSKKNIEKKDADIAALQQQYQKLSSAYTNKVNEANSKMKKIVEEANSRIQVANQPEVAVRVGFRKAMLSSGNVASFNNMSIQTIAVTINVNRAGQSRSFDMTLDPGVTKEIGEREGWAFISGDDITVTQPEHKTKFFKAP